MQTQTSESMVVRLADLDHLLQVAGDVIINASNLTYIYREVLTLFERGTVLDGETLKTMRELAEAASRNGENLHDLVQVIRTVTLKDLVFRARRTVRETARKTGKRVRLEVQGENHLLDKTIVEALYDPLGHQLRNAVTHGIEDPRTRANSGKPEEGIISIHISKNETETFIQITDDGAGIDLETLKQHAIDSGHLTDGSTLNDELALELICKPGLSTAESISESSGRGVGMDVVRDCIEGLGGNLSLHTEQGKGTQFTYRIPLVSAVNILDALIVNAGEHHFAFPIINVVASLSFATEKVQTTMEKGRVIRYLDGLLPLYDLSEVLEPEGGGLPPLQKGESLQILIIENKGVRIALRVTSFGEPQKLVIIPFGNGLHVRGLVGTTVLGGRELGFVVDVPVFLRRAEGIPEPTAIKAESKDQPKVSLGTQEGVEEQVEIEAPLTEDEIQERAYVVEAEKMLVSLNETLFQLEQEVDDELVNKAFRYFHTIKGNFAMMGFSKTAETIHSVESVLNCIRDRQINFGPEVMDIMMDGVSFVEDVLAQIKRDTWVDTLGTNITEGSAKILPKRETRQIREVNEAFELTSESAYRAAAASRAGIPSYHCHVRLQTGGELSFLRGCLIYKRLCEVGDVLACVPPLAELERGLVETQLKFLLATPRDPDRLESVLSRIFKEHYGVERFVIGK